MTARDNVIKTWLGMSTTKEEDNTMVQPDCRWTRSVQRYQSCMALANWPIEDMIPVVEKLSSSKPVDERVGTAYVLLRMGQPHNKMDPNH